MQAWMHPNSKIQAKKRGIVLDIIDWACEYYVQRVREPYSNNVHISSVSALASLETSLRESSNSSMSWCGLKLGETVV